MLNLFVYNRTTKTLEMPDISSLEKIREDRDYVLWLDMEAPTEEESSVLRDVFNFHELAIEDCLLAEAEEPKLDDYEDHLFIIVSAVSFSRSRDQFETTELDIFFGSGFVVTFHKKSIPGITTLRESVKKDETFMSKGSDNLLHAIVDRLVDNYSLSFKKFERYLYTVQAGIFENQDKEILNKLFNFKRTMLNLMLLMEPQREVLNRLSGGEIRFIDEENIPYFSDVYDHMDRIEGLMHSYNDLINGALDTYMSMSSNRMSQVMKTLTGISFIMLPLTFIASLYGMNFINMPGLKSPLGFPISMALMGILAGGMIWYFKKHKWF